jgi:antitoxin (DNA-binding transcriptional repressor) of toxin-antitoxin stability system
MQAQANLPELLRVVEGGGEVNVTRKKKVVARIVPANGKGASWSKHFAKLNEIFGGKSAPGKPGSRVVIEGRR